MPSATLLKRVRFDSFSDFVRAGWLVVIISRCCSESILMKVSDFIICITKVMLRDFQN